MNKANRFYHYLRVQVDGQLNEFIIKCNEKGQFDIEAQRKKFLKGNTTPIYSEWGLIQKIIKRHTSSSIYQEFLDGYHFMPFEHSITKGMPICVGWQDEEYSILYCPIDVENLEYINSVLEWNGFDTIAL